MSKFIFVTGGVISGIGKGITAASLGRQLKDRGYKIFVQKLDPYLNVDPGTMSPYQHGEVYVTHDGAETDLDLGHYERFIGEKLSKHSNYTSGRIYSDILKKERRGDYQGRTVQVIPHVTDEIIKKIKNAAKTSQADFIITEIGGTVGDIESQPFIHAIAEMGVKEKDVMFIHVLYAPYLFASKEFKTKPTQHALGTLRQYGIQPNAVVLRSHKKVPQNITQKIIWAAILNDNQIFNLPDTSNVYSIPLDIEKKGLPTLVEEHFNLEKRTPDSTKWAKWVEISSKKYENVLELAMVGKYVEYEDAYKSIIESLEIAAAYNGVKLNMRWIQSSTLTDENVAEALKGVDGVAILPGFGERGLEGKVTTVTHARNSDIPTFGICYGMQAMVIEQARRKGIKDACSSEVTDKGTFVIDYIRGKDASDDLGSTLRLGESTTNLKPNSLVAKIYNSDIAIERHRHRFEVNPECIEQIEDEDFVFSGHDAINNLAEIVELPKQKFFVGVQYHPEFTSNPLDPSPLFDAFVGAIKKHKK